MLEREDGCISAALESLESVEGVVVLEGLEALGGVVVFSSKELGSL